MIYRDKSTLEIVVDFFVSQKKPGQIEFFEKGRLPFVLHQCVVRDLLPYLQAFAETGEMPVPPEPERTPLEKLLERVNAVTKPRRLAGVGWSAPDDAIRIRAVAHRAAVLLDRSAATAIEFTGATEEMREFLDYVDTVAAIVRRHYDDDAICKALNAVPGKPVLFHADRWERKPGADHITLGSKTPHLYVTADVVWMSHKCLSDAAIAGYKKEFDGYMYAISKALKGCG